MAIGQKAAKSAKHRSIEDAVQDDPIKEALDTWTWRFAEVNIGCLTAAREEAKEKAKFTQKELELK